MATDELSELISALDASDPYRVVKLLGESSIERTELVVPHNAGASSGDRPGPRFVRKRITGAGVGAAYLRLYAAQLAGHPVDAAPRIVSCAGDADALTVVSEYVEGDTLKDTVEAKGASVELARTLFPAICDAVAQLHEQFDPPLIHRDLKPENIIIESDRAVIIDFTIARAYRDDVSTDTVTFGTRAYAPPEQFGYAQTTVRSDVYALGALLYFCLMGKNPDPEALSQGFPQVKDVPHLKSVLKCACAFDPDRRYANVRALKSAFMCAADDDARRSVFVPRLRRDASSADDAPSAYRESASAFGSSFGSSSTGSPASGGPSPTSAPGGNAQAPTYGYGYSALGDDAGENPLAPGPYRRSPGTDIALRVLGIVWNICLVIGGAIGAAACIANLFMPHPEPFAFSAASYPSLALVCVALTFALMDKRRLRARHPGNRWLTFVGGLKVLAIAIGIAIAAIVIAASATMAS